MKPSEKRALREAKLKAAEQEAMSAPAPEKPAQEEAPQKENIQEENIQEENTSGAEHTPYVRKEGFFGAHIRLITFIITATLVLTVFGPLGVDMLVASKNNRGVTNLEDMSIDTVYTIHRNADVIEWKNLQKFNYSDYSYENEGGKYLVREYPIADSRLVLKVGGPKLASKPEYIQLIDYRSGEYVNVLLEDPRDFVKAIEE